MVGRKRGAARGSYNEEDTVRTLEVCLGFLLEVLPGPDQKILGHRHCTDQ